MEHMLHVREVHVALHEEYKLHQSTGFTFTACEVHVASRQIVYVYNPSAWVMRGLKIP